MGSGCCTRFQLLEEHRRRVVEIDSDHAVVEAVERLETHGKATHPVDWKMGGGADPVIGNQTTT